MTDENKGGLHRIKLLGIEYMYVQHGKILSGTRIVGIHILNSVRHFQVTKNR